MDVTLNWRKLYDEGRCKDIGVYWSEEERKAIHIHKIPVDYVRMGIITPDEYNRQLQEELKTGKKPLEKWEMSDLTTKAQELGVKMSPDITKSMLVKEIKHRLELKEQKQKQQAALAAAYKKQEEEEAKEKARAEKLKEKAKAEMVDEAVKEQAVSEKRVDDLVKNIVKPKEVN